MIRLAGMVLVIVSALEAVAFVVAYHLSAPWRESHAGRHIMAFTAVLAAVLVLWSVGLLIPTKGPWWDVVRLVAFAGVPVLLGHRLWLLWRLQIRPAFRRGQRERKT